MPLYLDASLDARLDAVESTRVAVYGPGIDPTGVADSTAAIQALIDAAPAGSTLVYPQGKFKFSSFTLTKDVTFEGAGWWSNVVAAFGNAAWDGLAAGFKGTILISTVTSNYAISTNFSSAKLTLRNFLLIGPGSGTSVGVGLGRAVGVHGAYVENVLVCNFKTCWELDLCLDSTFINAWSRGCTTGIRLNNESNQNNFFNTQVQFSDGYAIRAGDASGVVNNCFYGGLIQNASGTAGIFADYGDANHFDGFYYEACTATHTVDFGPNGVGHSHTKAHYASTVTDLARTACNDSRIGPHYTVTDAKVVEVVSGAQRVVLDHVGVGGNSGTVTDAGTSTLTLARLTGSKTWDPGSISNGSMEGTTVTVTGAALGDIASASFDPTGGLPMYTLMAASVTAANTVTVTVYNQTGSALDLASGTLRAQVWKK